MSCTDSSSCADGFRCRRGYCTEEARRTWVSFGVSPALLTDDDDRGAAVGGGGSDFSGYLHIYEVGGRTPLRLSLLAGVDFLFGNWRTKFAFRFTTDLGLRLYLGTPRVAFALTALYGFGVAIAESRTDFIAGSYLLGGGLHFRRFGFGLSYREASRRANTPLRSVNLYFQWGF